MAAVIIIFLRHLTTTHQPDQTTCTTTYNLIWQDIKNTVLYYISEAKLSLVQPKAFEHSKRSLTNVFFWSTLSSKMKLLA